MASTPNCINFPEESQGIEREMFLRIFQECSIAERKIWNVLCSFSKQYVSVFPSQKTIAKLAKCTDRTVRRAVTKFQQLSWVKVIHRRYASCVYKINLSLVDIDTRSAKTFIRPKHGLGEADKPKVLRFLQVYLEQFTPTQKRIFRSLQKRAIFRSAFFSFKSLSQCAKCSVTAINQFLKKFSQLIGFILFRRGNRKSIFSILTCLTEIDLRKKETFEILNYTEQKPKSSHRMDQVVEAKFILRHFKLPPKDLNILSRYRACVVARAAEDLETYQQRTAVKNPAAFLMSRCKAHLAKLG